ncbi:MAG: DUF2909 domain-containing protein [Gammaproteobacteria bacterium]|nr:MAG: DUF2909 domain-containing protein [Gammaproteobacteria bacterium]
MLLKAIIVFLFVGVLISLSSALVFLMKDVGNPRKRTLYALGIRITFATLLIATIFYGFYTGQLSSKAPWDRQLHPAASYQQPSQNPDNN